MAQHNIVSELKHDNPDAGLFDLVAAYFTACETTAQLSDRYADLEKYEPYDEEELKAARAAFDAACHNDERLADQVAACPAYTLEGAQAKAKAALAYWGDQLAYNAIARALCDDLVRLPRGFV